MMIISSNSKTNKFDTSETYTIISSISISAKVAHFPYMNKFHLNRNHSDCLNMVSRIKDACGQLRHGAAYFQTHATHDSISIICGYGDMSCMPALSEFQDHLNEVRVSLASVLGESSANNLEISLQIESCYC